MKQLLDDVVEVELLGMQFADIYREVQQCTSDIASMSAALEVLAQPVQTPGQQHKLTWTKRPGGVTIALTLDKVQHLLRKDLSDSKHRLARLQQTQKKLTEALSDKGDPVQAMFNAV